MDSLQLDEIFLATVALIFALSLAAAVVGRLAKDKCLKLMHDHHVTYLPETGPIILGDMHVRSHGFEIIFDSPFVSSRDLAKTGCLIYEDKAPHALAICRTIHGLTKDELRDREKQIARGVHPGLLRRLRRGIANSLNVVRDAIVNALGLVIGRFAGAGIGSAVKAQSGQVTEFSGTLLGMVANAYEPLLERHIGKPVILEVLYPNDAPFRSGEFPGYLVEYNQTFIALLSPDRSSQERIEAEVDETTELEGCTVELTEGHVSVVCTGEDAIVVKQLILDSREMDMAAALLPGQRLTFHRPSVGRVRLSAERTRRLDLVVPRSRARVRFSSIPRKAERKEWSGVAPEIHTPPNKEPPAFAQ
jgi:hypothetical protein